MSIPKYKLTYFDVRGLGEPLRWMFNYAGVPFDDHRIPWDYPSWFESIKQNYSSSVGQIPVLNVDGKEICQSGAISRFLAREFGLEGETTWEKARADEVISMIFDLFDIWRKTCLFEKDPARKAFLKAQFVNPKFKLAYAKWNQMLVDSGDFVAGKNLTHADFWLACFISVWDDPVDPTAAVPIMPWGLSLPSEEDFYTNMTKDFPKLNLHKERIQAIPQIAEWIAKRPKTMG